jgi:hypothetical protein
MVVNDSISFLEQELGANFPIIILKKCYNSQEFDRLWSETGISGKRPTAFIVHSPFGLTPAQVVIDLQKLLSYNAESFVLNFVLTILEELLHSVYPLNTESQTHKLLYPLAEEFLSIKLPEEYKNFNIDE